MIDFEKELEKFKPSAETDQVEEVIMSRDVTDVTDILLQMMKEKEEKK